MKYSLIAICLLFVVGCSKPPTTQSYPYIDQTVEYVYTDNRGMSNYAVNTKVWVKEDGQVKNLLFPGGWQVFEDELEEEKSHQMAKAEETLKNYKKWKNSQRDNKIKFTGGEGSPSLSFGDNFNTGVAGFTDESLEILSAGKVIIQFSFPDKKIIGIDNRTIGYLNDEEVKLLQEFFSTIKKEAENE